MPATAEPTPARAAAPRHDKRARLLVPLGLLALAAFVGGIVMASPGSPGREEVAQRFVAAWAKNDFRAMHAQLAPSSRKRVPYGRFARLYRQAAETATVERVERAGQIRERDDTFRVPVRARTRVFGALEGTLALRVAEEEEGTGVVWDRHLVLPGMRRAEKLRRDVFAPPRADLQARDGTILASGPQRLPQGAPLPGALVGTVGPIPKEKAKEYERRGYPKDAVVGLTGLERELESRLAGRFGGFLRSSGRVLARAEERQAAPVRTAIDPGVQEAAVTALGARLGGIAVMRPQTGEVMALAGIAYSAPQPPGSVFKIITLAGALEEGVVKPSAKYPVETFTTIEGVELENANGESCGGSLGNSFAHSCNSVFAPLGAKLGADKLVATAEAFGFNKRPSLMGAAESTIPGADVIGDDLAVGSSAIGQGIVQATPLKMVEVAGAIANRGEMVQATLMRGGRGARSRVISEQTARVVDRFMRRVVSDGTGTAAQIKGTRVAGKTGTAELRDTTPDEEATPGPSATPVPVADDRTDTTAWFVAYAPASRPRVAVAVMLVGEGAGGESAAPAAREVLLKALRG